jgi:uncharacterized membrane protein YeaQ/YmgE (transglycosylase-associated protein family)
MLVVQRSLPGHCRDLRLPGRACRSGRRLTSGPREFLHRETVGLRIICRRKRSARPDRPSNAFHNLTEGNIMNFIIWLVVGGLIGWIASMIMRTDAQQGVILNVVVGIVGSMLGGWFIAPLLGTGTINQNDFSVMGLLASLIGAVILLAIVNLFRRGSVR